MDHHRWENDVLQQTQRQLVRRITQPELRSLRSLHGPPRHLPQRPRPDKTHYLCNVLSGANLDELVDDRRGDIEAVRYAIEAGVDTNALDAGTWPADYNLDRAEDLVARGLAELALLELP